MFVVKDLEGRYMEGRRISCRVLCVLVIIRTGEGGPKAEKKC